MNAGTRAHRASTIGIDVWPMRPDPTGVGVYVTELATALDQLEPGRTVRLGRSLQITGAPRGGSATTRFHLAWVLAAADADAGRAGCELVHYTNAVAPLRHRVPFVVSIHDVSVLRLPAHHPVRRLAIVPFMLAASRGARQVIVPSSATADEVRRVLHVPGNRISVIPLAARRLAVPPAGDTTLADIGLRAGRYVLALGTIEPRKNHVRLLAAFERIAATLPDLRLVYVGDRGWRNGRFWRALASSPVRERVIVSGRLSDAALSALLGSCAMLAYPSVYEGFGLPILEGMAAGAPVVTSRTSSMIEVAGDAAVLVDPLDPDSIADGMLEALRRRNELVAAGLARAAGRTWLDVAQETVSAYDRALAAR
jgi:glycosyltransferase involved in cell wall biosynthesis